MSIWPLDYSYGDPRYWDERYTDHLDRKYLDNAELFEWYNFDWNELKDVLTPLFLYKKEDKCHNFLQIGCGNSPISFEIRKIMPDTCNILNLDLSERVIEHMKTYDEGKDMQWIAADAVELTSVIKEKIDIVFDKGTIDAVYHGTGVEGDGKDGPERAARILKNVISVLRRGDNGSGRFVCVSQSSLEDRKQFFDHILSSHGVPYEWVKAEQLPKPVATEANISVCLLVIDV